MHNGNRELVRRVNALERRLDDLAMPEISPDLASPLLSLPSLIATWVGSTDLDSDWGDIGGKDHRVHQHGTPQMNVDGIAPYWYLDGSGEYFSIADAECASQFDVSGTETFIDSGMRGLTLLGWFYPEETETLEELISKWGNAGDRAYRLYLNASDQFVMEFSDDGTNSDTATSAAVTMDAWYFVVGRVYPSSFVDVFVGSATGLAETNAATARASIFDSASDFIIGARPGGAEEFQGRVACVAACSCACSDAILSSVFNRQRGAFGV